MRDNKVRVQMCAFFDAQKEGNGVEGLTIFIFMQ